MTRLHSEPLPLEPVHRLEKTLFEKSELTVALNEELAEVAKLRDAVQAAVEEHESLEKQRMEIQENSEKVCHFALRSLLNVLFRKKTFIFSFSLVKNVKLLHFGAENLHFSDPVYKLASAMLFLLCENGKGNS